MSARWRHAGSALLAASMLLVVGCSDDDSSSAASPESSTTSTTAVTEVPGAELVGRWAHYDIVAYEDTLMKTMIVSYGFTDFAVEDGQLIESEEFCHADQISDQPIKTSISDAATQAIKPVSTPV